MLEFANFLIHFAALFLALNASANDILVATTTIIGSRSLHRRAILFIILVSVVFSYFVLKGTRTAKTEGTGSWVEIISGETRVSDDLEKKRTVLGVAIISSCFFTIISILSKIPLPLDTSLCPFLYGYLLNSASPSSPSPLITIIKSLLLPYCILPIISGCLTWSIYRILIKGIMFADDEDKFRRTLSWCAFIYPASLAICLTAISLKYFISSYSYNYKHIFAYIILFISALIFYAFFKVFLRAWLKRRVFLLYPQEYALYMERSEKVEQGDREARGLGPIQDYYLPKVSAASSSVTKQSQSIKDNNSTILPSQSAISPAVIAGKLAITTKRSEELFRPILNVISIVTMFVLVSFESENVLLIVNQVIPADLVSPTFILWTFILFILPGSLFLSRKFAVFLGRNIINEMRFSQAYAIQMGTLLTITLSSLLQTIHQAPSWYLLFSIAAVSSSQRDQSSDVEVGNNSPNFRYKMRSVALFWFGSILFSAFLGALLSADL